MEIITPGNLERLHNPKIFTCKRCGCVFKATDKEYVYGDYIAATHDGIYASCTCPCCEDTVYLYSSDLE